MPILLDEFLLVLRDIAVNLFQTEYLILKSFDVEFFSLSVCPTRDTLSAQGKRGMERHGMMDVMLILTYRWACRFNSCRLVRAGLLSGFGPRRFGGCPSIAAKLAPVRDEARQVCAMCLPSNIPLVVLFSVKVLRKLRLSEDKGLLSWVAGAGDPPL